MWPLGQQKLQKCNIFSKLIDATTGNMTFSRKAKEVRRRDVITSEMENLNTPIINDTIGAMCRDRLPAGRTRSSF